MPMSIPASDMCDHDKLMDLRDRAREAGDRARHLAQQLCMMACGCYVGSGKVARYFPTVIEDHRFLDSQLARIEADAMDLIYGSLRGTLTDEHDTTYTYLEDIGFRSRCDACGHEEFYGVERNQYCRRCGRRIIDVYAGDRSGD